MARSSEILAELRTLGYDGPSSRSKPQLEAILEDYRKAASLEDEPLVGDGPTWTSWKGLRQGDRVRITTDDKGTYAFRFYFRDERQEYVELYGPLPSGRKPKAPGTRSVHPWVVTSLAGRVLDPREEGDG